MMGVSGCFCFELPTSLFSEHSQHNEGEIITKRPKALVGQLTDAFLPAIDHQNVTNGFGGGPEAEGDLLMFGDC